MANETERPVTHTGHWREKFGGPSRKPRHWNEEVRAFLHDCWPTEVLLREDSTATEIVLRFPFSSKHLPENIQSKYFGHELSLSLAFNEVVWTAPEKGQQSCWSRLAKAGYDAYWSAWMHLLRVLYCEHLFPDGNEVEEIWLAELKASRRYRSGSGRRGELEAERKSFVYRFDELLEWCKDLRDIIKQCNHDKLSEEETKNRVFQKISSHRHDHNVLSGRAFCWDKNRINPVLCDHQTWTPKELAFALLALERYGTLQAYATVKRKVGAHIPPSRARKKLGV